MTDFARYCTKRACAWPLAATADTTRRAANADFSINTSAPYVWRQSSAKRGSGPDPLIAAGPQKSLSAGT